MDLVMKTAAGGQFDLDFEPLRSLAADPRYFVPTILEEINRGIYDGMVPPGSTIIDLGANIGLFSLYAAAAARTVYAVEPTPSHRGVMADLVGKLGVTNIVPVASAAWVRDGELSFYLDPNNTTMNRIDFGAECYQRTPCTELVVPCFTIASLLDRYDIRHVDLLKVDIEGAELDLVQSDGFVRAVPQIDAVYMECHNYKDWGDGVKVAEDVRDALRPHYPEISGFWARGMLARKAKA